MKIDRSILIEELFNFSQQSSGLIIGGPGIGKSYALSQLEKKLISKNIPVFLLRIDTMINCSNTTIKSHLGCAEYWIDYLNEVIPTNTDFKSVLIFDAFDATRDYEIRRQFLEKISLARKTLKNWHILVSVRTYDAKKSPMLKNIFEVSGDNSGTNVPIFKIEKLCENELDSAFDDNKILGDVYRSANENLREILRIPFYLQQLELVLRNSKNVNVEEIKLFNSTSEILDKFFEIRINLNERRLLKESLLKNISDSLVKNRRLSCNKSDFVDNTDIFEELISDGVISEVGYSNRNVAFSHNILFDYFVGRLSIPCNPDEVLKFLNEDKTRAFFLRPSLVFLYTGLWYNDRPEFWKHFKYFLKIEGTHIDLFKRLILISIATCEFESVDDIRLIVNNNILIRQLLQSLNFLPNRKLAERDVLLLLELSKKLKIDYLIEFAIIFNLVIDNYPLLKKSVNRINCGIIARNFMKFIMANRIKNEVVNRVIDNLGSNLGVTFIAKTYDTNDVESQKIFKEILELLQEEDFNINYFSRLTKNLKFYGAVDAKFTSEIFNRLFSYEEESNDTTYLGGVLLPLTSTRKQDFSLIHNYLFEYFDTFLSVSPEVAVVIGLKISNDYVLKKKIRQKRENLQVDKIKLDELQCEFVSDRSSIWDESLMNSNTIELTNKIIVFLKELLTSKKSSKLNGLIPIYLTNCLVAYTWKKFLELILEDVKFFKGYFYQIISNPIFLYNSDTIYEVGQILKTIYPHYSIKERHEIEKNIIKLYNNDDMLEKDCTSYQVIKLINCIPVTLLTNSMALQIKSENDIVNNEPYINSHSYSSAISEISLLENERINDKDQKVVSLIAYKDEFRNFNKKWINLKPNYNEFGSLKEQAERSFELAIDKKSTVERIKTQFLCELCKFYSIVMWQRTNLNTVEFEHAKKIVMYCIDYQSELDDMQSKELSANSGYSPTPRIEASNVIPILYKFEQDDLIFAKILQLTRDENSIVRFHILKNLYAIYSIKPEEFWQIAEERLKNEQSSFNLGVLLNNIYIDKIVNHDLENFLHAIELASKRVNEFKRNDSFLEVYISLLLYLHDTNIAKWSEEYLYDICCDTEPSHAIATKIFDFIDPAKNDNDYTINEKLHCNLFELLKYINKRILEKLVEADLIVQKKDNSPEKDRLLIIDYIIQRIYFTLIYNRRNKNNPKPNVTDENKISFFNKLKPIVEEVINASPQIGEGTMLASTTNYLLEIFNGLLKFHQSEAEFFLDMTFEISKLSKKSGYLLDQSSINEIIKITESLFADHKDLLLKSDKLEKLISILNIYVEAGWTQALELLWKLDEVYK